jgi:hypothetical protein
VKTITREDFEKMEDEANKKPKLTLEDKLARLDSKGIQVQVEKQQELVAKKNGVVENMKKAGDKIDANKYQAAKEQLENELATLKIMTDALTLRLEEEAAQKLKEEQAKKQ